MLFMSKVSGLEKLFEKLSKETGDGADNNDDTEALIKKELVELNIDLPCLTVYVFDRDGKSVKERPSFEVISFSSGEAKKTTIAELLKTEFKVNNLNKTAQLKVWGNAKEPGSESEALRSGKGWTPKSSVFKLYNYVYGGAAAMSATAKAYRAKITDVARRFRAGELDYWGCRKALAAGPDYSRDLCIQLP